MDGGGDGRVRRLRREPGGRQHAVKVLLSDAEHGRITARAAELRMSVPRFLVEAGMATAGGGVMPATVRNALVAEFVGARTVIARAGVNLEQVAVRLTTTGSVPSELAAVLEAVARGLARLETAVEELRR